MSPASTSSTLIPRDDKLDSKWSSSVDEENSGSWVIPITGGEGSRPPVCRHVGPRPTTCFETFPLPWPPGEESERVAAAARALMERWDRWLDPPEWVAEVAAKVDVAEDFSRVPADARPLVRESAVAAEAARDPRLKKRTLTNLYNDRPEWLRLAHGELDAAVLACYAAVDPEGDWGSIAPAPWRDAGAGSPPQTEARRAADRAVLSGLLRLNAARSRRGLS